MTVICLDCDGTLDVSGGPVTVQRILELIDAGVKAYMVSSAEGCASVPLARIVESSRLENLHKVKSLHPEEKLFIYVSDNTGDDSLSYQAGYCYIHPKNFK